MDKETPFKDSFDNNEFGIGQMADGSFNSFPASELDKRTAERDKQDEIDQYVLEQSENGFADPFLEDDSDLDLDDEDDAEEE